MGNSIIHETIIRDVMDVIADVKDSEEIKGLRNRSGSFKSIASASQNLTLVFPVITSTSLSIEAASMITKAYERKAVSMLQILFTSASITDSTNGLDYLKKFHTNLKVSDNITVDSLIDALDKYVVQKEGMTYAQKQAYKAISEDVRRNLNTFVPDEISEHGLHECTIIGDHIMMTEGVNYEEESLNRKVRAIQKQAFKESFIHEADDDKTLSSKDVGKAIGKINITNNYSSGGGGGFFSRSTSTKDRVDARKNGAEFLQKQLIKTDVQKANELVPTMMVVNFVTTNSEEPIEAQMVIGVKAKMYPVDSMDIIERVQLKYKDNNSLIKFIRSTTREISFFKDFLFAIDKAKLDALSQSKRGSSSPLWKVLERRSKKSKLRRILGQTNDASAITSMQISQEEADYLKKSENINIEDPKVARSIMESYNFMSICIVDEAAEVAKFIFDTGDDIFESMSFTSLERESNDNSKKIINLMSKMSR